MLCDVESHVNEAAAVPPVRAHLADRDAWPSYTLRKA